MVKVLGAQLYTVRDYCKSSMEIDSTFRKIREIGYTTVQVSGIARIPAEELKAIADSHNLKIVITHNAYERFVNDLDALIADHHTLGCDIAGLGSLPAIYSRSGDGFSAFAKEVNLIAEELAKNGMKFSYHNHRFEFEKFDGKLGLDILIEQTNPENFLFTLDTFWVQAGGADPAEYIKKLSGRIAAIHFKDMAIIDDKQVMTEIMEGNLNWQAIFNASEQAGVKWYLVERDDGPTEAFESLRVSYNNLVREGFR